MVPRWQVALKSRLVYRTDVREELVTSAEKKDISRNPFKRTMRLNMSKKSNLDEKLSKSDAKRSNPSEKYSKPDEKLSEQKARLSKPEKRTRPDEENSRPTCFYPVDIRLDSAARYMWIRRLLGMVDGVRVYTGPLAKL